MEYIEIDKLDLENTFYHFSRTANRNSINENGIVAVAGGENKAGNDYNNPTTYFSYGADGVLKAVDVWIKWEYNKIRWENGIKEFSPDKLDDNSMNKTYEKIYDDFKDRIYYKLDLVEGEDLETSDFSFNGIDKKKEQEYQNYVYLMKKYEDGEIEWKPKYPNKIMEWMYGSYSDLSEGNIKQDTWNMNTHVGEKVISTDKIKIIQASNRRTDALSIVFEIYDKYSEKLTDIDLSILDDFMIYAKDRYKTDKDYKEGMPDLGRREISKEEEERFQEINKIDTQKLGKEVAQEIDDTEYMDETQNEIIKQENKLLNKKENKMVGG